ncbi:MAG TPA: PEGA domain-containing protein [bacterium]|nr:PEGA domain-containing protein [bacterium]
MHISLRRLIFLVFVLVFVITAPLVVFYTAGYRLNISNRHLQQTGVLAITTYPRGSNIVLNGQNLAQKTPYVVQRIMPNLHEITLQKKGYHEWSQKLRVDEGKTSYVTARLFADTEPVLLEGSAVSLALRAHDDHIITATDSASIRFFDNGANVEVKTGTSPTEELIALLPEGTYRLLEEDPEYILIADERNLGFMIARQGGEVVELPTAILAFDWLDNENLLIWTDGTEVNTYDAVSGEKTFITREGQTVHDVAWHPVADSFFVVSGTTLLAYDRNVHETREVVPLLVDTNMQDIWLDAGGKNLFFADAQITPGTTTAPSVYELPLVQ